ncbi:calcineurin-like phosphoesterase family protein [Lutibacter sp. Hel_I_33_5]|uniref:metallophosphoesterase n=1 Tax=Lutibacter sp. Hel_I_33_5 TaxID=1566289 RepID=UPI0011A82ACD|nr:metallophosphoesterase [Lutibacter sp. Hel_I_33_5]TVZ56209.1 calcineurin-like phosphoesterase family protein [Lutibacter sp. Hel_I_33_5]
MSSNSRISKAFKEAKKLPLNKDSKYILFSDCHRGDNSFADDFARNRNVYKYAFNHYFDEGFTYIELGDGDELWENSDFKNIFRANKYIYLLLKKFHDDNRLHFIWGNHDMDYKDPKYIKKNLHYYYDEVSETDKELLINASFSEAILLENQETKKSIFLLHGHQADWFNYTFWKLSRFLVRVLWKPLQILGISDPTSPAQNFKGLIKVEKRIEDWIKANNNQMVVIGHTHRPRFPDATEIPFFNDGSCVHPRAITGLEIENNQIALIKWHMTTKENGTLQIIRTVLEGPEDLNHFIN